MNMKESHAIILRKSAIVGILTEYAKFQNEIGKSKFEIFKEMGEKVNTVCAKLYVPNDGVFKKVMDNVYKVNERKKNILNCMVDSLVDITYDEDDTGVGLPKEVSKETKTIMESEKVIDISNDVIIKSWGEETLDKCIKELKDEFSSDFIKSLK